MLPQLIFLLLCFTASFSQWFSPNQATAHVALMLSHHIRGVCVMKTVLLTTNAVSLTVELSVSLLLSVRATMFNFFSSGQLLSLLSDWTDLGIKHGQSLLDLLFYPSLYILISLSPSAKPGVCPRRKWGAGMCAEFCSNDSDCPNAEKCCHNGCGHQCIAPYTG